MVACELIRATKLLTSWLFAIFFLFLLFLLLLQCTWQQRTRTGLTVGREAAIAASRMTEPFFAAKCIAIAEKCSDIKDVICKKLDKCQQTRARINKIIIAAQYASADGLAAIAIGDETSASAALGRAGQLLSDIHQQLIALGIMKTK